MMLTRKSAGVPVYRSESKLRRSLSGAIANTRIPVRRGFRLIFLNAKENRVGMN